jgi:DNA-binding LytR/AlgR family response regulator
MSIFLLINNLRANSRGMMLDDIHYLNADTDYTEFNLDHKKTPHGRISQTLGKGIKEHDFIRIHKLYIVNRTKVAKVSANRVYLFNYKQITIGRAYKEAFLKKTVK